MDKKEEIKKAGYHLFADKGYFFSMAEIADKVKLKVPSLYSHFSGKDTIVEIIVNEEIDEFFSDLNLNIKSIEKNCLDDYQLLLKNVFMYIIDYFREEKVIFWKNMTLISNYEIRNKIIDKIEENEKSLINKLKNVLTKAQERKVIKDGNIEGMVLLYMTMVYGYREINISIKRYKKNFVKESLEQVWKTYWNGIKNTEEKENEIN